MRRLATIAFDIGVASVWYELAPDGDNFWRWRCGVEGTGWSSHFVQEPRIPDRGAFFYVERVALAERVVRAWIADGSPNRRPVGAR